MSSKVKTHIYTNILMGDGYNAYYASLSKNTRQNIRTSYNRLEKDGKVLTSEFVRGCDLDSVTEDTIVNIYLRRRESHKNSDSYIHKLFLKYFHYFTQASKRFEYSIYGIVRIDGEIAAFWNGFVSTDGRYVSCPRLAIDERFNKYSPGILLINETAKNLKGRFGIDDLDLSRGNQDYKMRMGGINYYSYDFVL